MKTKITFTLLMLACLFSGQSQTFQWAKSMGGTINDYGQAITSDAAGNVYTTGYFTGNADFDPGVGTFTYNCLDNGDVFVSKLDANGNFVWAKKIAGNGASGDTGEGITLDASGNIYVTGRFSGTADFDPGVGTYTIASTGGYDIFVLKLDPSGNFIWAKRMHGSGTGTDIGKAIKLDASGNVYTSGYFQGTGDFDPGAGTYTLASSGGDEIFVSKLDNAGNFVWAKSLGGTGTDRTFGIALDALGNVYTNGYAGGGDFDPGVGVFTLPIGLFVSKLDNNGNFVWAKRFTGSFVNYSYGIAVDGSGNVYTTGQFQGSSATDFDPNAGTFNLIGGSASQFISKLDSAGNFVWAKKVAGAIGLAITLDASSNVYTTGYFTGTNDFDPGAGTYSLTSGGMNDIFVSKLDVGGNFVSAVSIGSSWDERSYSIHVDASCNIYFTGYYNGTVDFDPGTGVSNLSSLSSNDIYVEKLNCMPTGINTEHNLINLFTIYPNPSNGVFTLQLKEEMNSGELIVTDVMGKEILKQELNETKEVEIKLEAKGLYFVRLESEGKRLVKKVVVQ